MTLAGDAAAPPMAAGAGNVPGNEPATSGNADHGVSLRISVIMPVYNGAAVLPASLPPLQDMRARGEIGEILLVDDGSTDATPALARSFGVEVLSSGGRCGPGGARNVGVARAAGDVAWFVDADVIVHEDAARRVREAFEGADIVAVFGAYDDRPAGANFLSQYKNLVHHHYHARAAGDAATFWAGCGAVRKEAFIACGGFDAAAYPFPSIEDIELGYRLRQHGGRIVLAPALRGTHLKVWRLGNLLHTEIFRRAVPWSRLILARTGLHDSLNVATAERINALLALALAASILLALARVLPPWPIAVMTVAVALANRSLFATFRRARGVAFAFAAVAFHQIYYLYSSAAFAWCWLEHRLRGILPR